MIVEVVTGADERPEVRVVDVDDLGRLHLALGQVTDEEADAALREAGLGRLEDADSGVLDAAALRAAAESQAGSEAGAGDWPQRWEGLLETARDHGWVVDDGAGLRVHVESAAGA
ncbi:hypothetical protein JOD57_002781 [Geodermatophilus bullaregiensis]|uniref:hypothetical protein n=1 Tax=Geodermatophilus bullaregiensis TaxID=1564160 RepID=UPI001959D25B|nr:hypothetical protein [Geodermatophilus bullaregiensis]MBM7806944.1 hypothetical protein [Geodermatophilus bullaregiensis]